MARGGWRPGTNEPLQPQVVRKVECALNIGIRPVNPSVAAYSQPSCPHASPSPHCPGFTKRIRRSRGVYWVGRCPGSPRLRSLNATCTPSPVTLPGLAASQAKLWNPRGSAMVAPILFNQVKPLSFQTVAEAVRRLLNRLLHSSVEIKGI